MYDEIFLKYVPKHIHITFKHISEQWSFKNLNILIHINMSSFHMDNFIFGAN